MWLTKLQLYTLTIYNIEWISHILLRNNLTIVSRIFFFSFLVGFLVYANQLRRRLTVTFYTRSYNLERILVNISVISVHLSEHMTIIIASFFFTLPSFCPLVCFFSSLLRAQWSHRESASIHIIRNKFHM